MIIRIEALGHVLTITLGKPEAEQDEHTYPGIQRPAARGLRRTHHRAVRIQEATMINQICNAREVG